MTNPPSYPECRDLFAVLSEYLDATLPPADCAAIEAHIARCPPCVEFVNSLKKSVELCRQSGMSIDVPPLSEEVRDKLLAAYRKALSTSRE